MGTFGKTKGPEGLKDLGKGVKYDQSILYVCMKMPMKSIILYD
jgi:hypothetical protein